MRPLLLISIDGLRPDAIPLAGCQNILNLAENGSYTFQARTVMPSVTLPCHTSMFRGVDVERHGITTNTFIPLARPVPSIIDVADTAGLSCGMFYNWGPLRDLAGPESLKASFFERDAHRQEGDRRVMLHAARIIPELRLDFSFVYFGWVDECGHMHGWMSPEYLAAVKHADDCVGALLSELHDQGIEPTVLLLSDHGGHGKSHGTDSPEDMTIPWILSGPGIRRQNLPGPVRIFDTCPTIAELLGLKRHVYWEGQSLAPICADPS